MAMLKIGCAVRERLGLSPLFIVRVGPPRVVVIQCRHCWRGANLVYLESVDHQNMHTDDSQT